MTTTNNTAITALQHIAAGHDAVCTDCEWIGGLPVGSEYLDCPDCGSEALLFGADEIAAYALRQIEGGGEVSDQPCPCCGHDQVAVEMVIGDELEENKTLKAKVAALEARCAGLERERDAYRAVLDGAEFRLVDDFQSQGVDFARRLGAYTAAITKRVIAERDALQSKLAAAEEALRHTCKHLCQWKAACESGCPVSAILAGHAPTPACTCGSLKVKNNKSEWVCVECQGEGHAPATPQQAHLAQSGELWVGPEEDE